MKGTAMKSMTTSRRWITAVGVSALSALALAACAPQGADAEDDTGDDGATTQPADDSDADGEPAAGDGEALKVGYISPITGNFAVAGQEMVDGWELYWEINGNEVGGVTVETIVEDDAGNPEMSITKARKLVESDGVEEALLKAIRSLEQHVDSLMNDDYSGCTDDDIIEMLHRVDDKRIYVIAEAIRRGISHDRIHSITMIDDWFIDKIRILVEMEKRLASGELTKELLLEAKRIEFPDKVIGKLAGKTEKTEQIKQKYFSCRFKMQELHQFLFDVFAGKG